MRRMNATGLVLLGLGFVLGAASFSQSPPGNRHLNLPGRLDDLPYSHGVMAGNTLYLAGTIGIDEKTGLPPQAVEDEIRIAMDNIKKRLEMAGMTMNDLVSVQVFCPDLSLYDEFNAVYRTYFTGAFPSRAFIGSGPLLRGGRFEIQATAVKQ